MGKVYLASLFTNKKQHWGQGLISEVYGDGTFEVVPICNGWSEAYRGDVTYAGVPSWHDRKKSLAELLRYDKQRASLLVHDDPDLHTCFAYGDVWGPKSAALFRATPGDWLLVIANMAYAARFGQPDIGHALTGWHLVGCIAIEHMDYAGNGEFHGDRVRWHQHWRDAKRARYDRADGRYSVIVAGDPKQHEQRFERAVPLLTAGAVSALLRDRHGKPIDVNEKNAAGKRKFTSVMACLASYTRAIRPIADTDDEADASYLTRLRKAILVLNPQAKRVLW